MKFVFEKTSSNIEWHYLEILRQFNIEPDSVSLVQLGEELTVEFVAEKLPDNFEVDARDIDTLLSKQPPLTTQGEVQEQQDLAIIAALERTKDTVQFKNLFESLIRNEIERNRPS